MTIFSRTFIVFALLANVLLLAQSLSEDEVLERLRESAESLQDASFVLMGKLYDTDGTEISLEIDVQVIPAAEVARAEFFQPDALADNFIVVDGDRLYNYVFLTNQASLFEVGDPDALGGLLPMTGEGGGFDFTLDIASLFGGWDSSVTAYSAGIYQMRFDNKEAEVAIAYVEARIREDIWFPVELVFVSPEGRTLAELKFDRVQLDTGLDPEDVRFIPDDAEIIDQR